MEQREKRIAGLGELLALVREDLRYNGGIPWPGFQALAVYRFGVWKDGIGREAAAHPLHASSTGWPTSSCATSTASSCRSRPGSAGGSLVGHQHGIIVHGNAVIGDDCMIRQGVAIGQDAATPGVWVGHVPAPKLGNRVEVGAGAMLFGAITVGDGVRIGPNAVVMTNVPAGAIVTAPLSRIMLPPKRKPKPAPRGGAGAETGPSRARTAPEPEPEVDAARKTGNEPDRHPRPTRPRSRRSARSIWRRGATPPPPRPSRPRPR